MASKTLLCLSVLLQFIVPSICGTIAVQDSPALILPDRKRQDSPKCPGVWKSVRTDLLEYFGGCSVNASFAIRFAFHDAAAYSSQTPFYEPAAGGADGSLLLSDTEIFRFQNSVMGNYRVDLLNVYNKYHESDGISAADLVQFAASLAIYTCPGGPAVQTVVGRTDNANAAPDCFLPDSLGPNAAAGVLVSVSADKGFDLTDLVALVGAHTVSRSFATPNIPFGAEQDTTPSTWDATYFSETQNGAENVVSFESDKNLAASNDTGALYSQFGQDPARWNEVFVSAMARLSVLGIPLEVQQTFVDCTSVMTGADA